MVKDWQQNVKRRRAQQMKMIQEGFTESNSFYPSPWQQSTSEALWQANPTAKKKSKKGKWIWQSVISVLLFAFTYTVFQGHTSKALQVQQWIQQWVNRPVHFDSLADWYRQNWGERPALLPAFSAQKEKSTQKPDYWTAPVQGKLMLPFDQKRKGILIKTKDQAQVKAPSAGWVVYSGKHKDFGDTIILQHANGKQTWYGLLGQRKVAKKEWVKKGHLLGTAGEHEGSSYVYIAYRKQGDFLDPTDVMPFAF